VRGGSWIDGPFSLRSAYRDRNSSVYRSTIQGFRVARTLP
jgi:formylglycine-generating enzyme required for sulfatase activity